MTVKEREDLFDNNQSFLELKPEQRQRLHDLYTGIQEDAARDKLLALMTRYWEWYSAQSAAMRNGQQQLEPEKRIAEIKKQLEKGTLTGNEIHLDEESRAGLVRWMDFYTTQHEARILQDWARTRGGLGRPFGGLQQRPTPNSTADPAAALAKLPPQRKREIVRQWLRRSLQSDNAAQHPPISKDEMANLRASLSPDVRTKLDEVRKPEDQLRIIASWLRETLRPEFEDQVVDFFETLDREQRDRLMALPVDEMYRELGRMYMAAAGGGPRPGDQWNNRPDRGRRGGRQGGGGRRRVDDSQMRDQPPLVEPKGNQSPQDSAANKPAAKAQNQ
jgi:hypothetical protein